MKDEQQDDAKLGRFGREATGSLQNLHELKDRGESEALFLSPLRVSGLRFRNIMLKPKAHRSTHRIIAYPEPETLNPSSPLGWVLPPPSKSLY